eukprot:11525170-Alexandrium_andersonii.AAC.1
MSPSLSDPSLAYRIFQRARGAQENALRRLEAPGSARKRLKALGSAWMRLEVPGALGRACCCSSKRLEGP